MTILDWVVNTRLVFIIALTQENKVWSLTTDDVETTLGRLSHATFIIPNA